MNEILYYFSMASFIFSIFIVIDIIYGSSTIRKLKDIKPGLPPAPPKVSIIIPCRNEERNIEEALQSVLKLDYPNCEIIAVNDRSTDRTGEILARIASEHSSLRLENITKLPDGWLGKNYALYYGAEKASGEYLLFTDADIVMKKDVLTKAMSYVLENKIDHLASTADIIMPNAVMNMFTGAFIIFFSIFAKPWKAKDPKSNRSIGIGAFNLIRKEAYCKSGTHEKVRMRPDDDIKLGKIIKQSGFRQELVFGKNMMSVNWYSSVKELVHGMEKNAFAGIEYNIFTAIGSFISLLLFFVFPFLAVFLTSGLTQLFFFGIDLNLIILYWLSAKDQNLKPWYSIGFPFATILFIYIIERAAFVTLKNGGIRWRDTFYSLKELKANKI